MNLPYTSGPRCRDRHRGHVCTRARGHRGRHAAFWLHLSRHGYGRVRAVWGQLDRPQESR